MDFCFWQFFRSQWPCRSRPVRSRTRSGFYDGQALVFNLAVLSRLPGCYVEVPELPAEYADPSLTRALIGEKSQRAIVRGLAH